MRPTLLMASFLLATFAVARAAEDPLPAAPPEGWKEFISPTKAFSVWLPKGGLRTERTREIDFGKAKAKVSLIQLETDDKVIYVAGQIALPVAAGQKVDANAAIEAFRDGFIKDGGGKVKDESEIKLGKMAGREYQIELEKGKVAILRLYAAGPRIYQVAVTGSKEQVEGDAAKLFLRSYKHQGMVKDDEARRAKEKKDKK